MTHDPFKIHRELSCPCCHVKGQVVTNEADGVEFDQGCFADEPFVCCSCGASWLDAGTFCDDALKEYRVAFSRVSEGRPYEPPKPKEPVKSKLDFSAYDSVLRDHYAAELSSYEEAAKAWEYKIVRLAALKADTWKLPTTPAELVEVGIDEPAPQWTNLGDWMDRAAKLGEDDTE